MAWWELAELIHNKWGTKVVLELINMPSASGRGVIDFALGTKVMFANEIRRKIKGSHQLLEGSPRPKTETAGSAQGFVGAGSAHSWDDASSARGRRGAGGARRWEDSGAAHSW